MSFGDRVEKRRVELGFSQTKLAGIIGIGQSQLSKIEKGTIGVEKHPELVGKLESALQLNRGELLALLPETSMARRIAKLPTYHPVDLTDTVPIQDWGEVSAGEPRPQAEPVTVRVPKALLPNSSGTLVMFRVRGQSMTKKHIQDGSVLFVRIDPDPRPGEKVVAVVNSRKKRGARGYVVKILKQGDDGMELHSASEEEPAEPMIVDDTVDVVGVVVGVFNT